MPSDAAANNPSAIASSKFKDDSDGDDEQRVVGGRVAKALISVATAAAVRTRRKNFMLCLMCSTTKIRDVLLTFFSIAKN